MQVYASVVTERNDIRGDVMRIAIVTDAWLPQLNGVVTTIVSTKLELEKMGHTVMVVSPDRFPINFPLPFYKSIRVALPGPKLFHMLDRFKPNAIHIATEWTIGLAAQWYCQMRGLPFSTAYHTHFPTYIAGICEKKLRGSYRFVFNAVTAYMRFFHRGSSSVMVSTLSLMKELEDRGFKNLAFWSRGVDHSIFRPGAHDEICALSNIDRKKKKILLYFGRVADEKNLEAFLSLNFPEENAVKVVLGDGPARSALERKFSDALFLGEYRGEDLARLVRCADVMVFPSRTDTFGLVVIEANACGVPVAAFPVMGPKDIIRNGINGWVLDDLKEAIRRCLLVDKMNCIEVSKQYTWSRAAAQFYENLIMDAKKCCAPAE